MSPRRPVASAFTVALALSATALAPASASAVVGHVVQPDETLWSIAAANNLTTRTVAAYNGLPETANVVLGSTVNVPTVAEGAVALQGAGVTPAATPGSTAATPTLTPAATPSASAPKALGGYTVRTGDTLSGLAAGAGVATSQLAAANGLATDAHVITGTVLKLPNGAPVPARAAEPEPTAKVVPAAAPAPTATRVGASDVQSIASAAGVSPSLAAAIGWQESGFNNNAVSSANARGVMQVMPGTWSWVQKNLAARKLDPSSAHDNVHAGVLYLKQLLKETGGDESTAIAGYYQGLGAVRERGLFDDTKRYVANVQALRSRFGG